MRQARSQGITTQKLVNMLLGSEWKDKGLTATRTRTAQVRSASTYVCGASSPHGMPIAYALID